MTDKQLIQNPWLFLKADPSGAHYPDYNDRHWHEVLVPHTWNKDDMFPGNPMEEAYIGPAWYRKHLPLSKPEGTDRVFLHFEAVANRSQLWVNGRYAGGYNAGFLGYRVDVTELLVEGEEQVLALKADNSFREGENIPPSIDWERYGGLYRPVHLERKGWAHFEFASLRHTVTWTEDGAKIKLNGRVRSTQSGTGSLALECRLMDPDGKQCHDLKEQLNLFPHRTVDLDFTLSDMPSPRLWDVDDPQLYQAECRLLDGETVLDEETIPLGFRKTEWCKERGFLLNGRELPLLGVNMHQDYPGLGNACPERFFRRELEMLKDCGMNYIRGSHYPRNRRSLDLCDRMGILVMEEQPFWHGSIRESDGPTYIEYARQQMREMVSQHGNHPCIIGWNTVNEIMLTPQMGEKHTRPEERDQRHMLPEGEWSFAARVIEAMNDELHRQDPTRATMMVIGGSWEQNERVGTTRFADIIGMNGGAFNRKTDEGWVCDILRKRHPDQAIILSEGILNDGDDPERANWDVEARRWHFLCGSWERIYARPWFSGGSMWVWADYSAFGTYRTMAVVDLWRTPNEAYHLFRAMWHPDLNVHIQGHWSHELEEGEDVEVVVFSNGEDVELFLNGRSLGHGESSGYAIPHPPRVWKVPFERGELRAVARRAGKSEESLRISEGTPTRLKIQAENEQILSDGVDVAFIDLLLEDQAGNRCYRAFDQVDLKVEGAAVLCGPSELKIRGGLARFAIRSNGEEKDVYLTVRWKGHDEELVLKAYPAND